MKFNHNFKKNAFIGILIALVIYWLYNYFFTTFEGLGGAHNVDHCKDIKHCKKCINASNKCYWNSSKNECHKGKEGKYSTRKCPQPSQSPTTTNTNAASTAATTTAVTSGASAATAANTTK
jgi:hypothetical protein